MRKTSLLAMLSFTVVSHLCNYACSQLLLRQKVFTSPETWVMNKAVANTHWNKDVYCQVYSSAFAYVGDTLYNIWHVMDVQADPCWSRLIYADQKYNEASRMRAHGEFGSGIDSLDEPMAVKVISQTSNQRPYMDYYYIYVADRQNHRVERLHYQWTTPDSGLIHDYYCNATMWRPTDLDVSNRGSFDNVWGYETWVACKSDKIYAFNYGGQQILSYGSTGSGVGQFNDIRAVVCGKTLYNGSTGTWFANNDFVYVLDAGNRRIVRLFRDSYYSLAWNFVYTNIALANATDLEVDVCGNIWVTRSEGPILKFTGYLDPLGVFGSSGTGPNQFDYPVSIANTGGHLGGGDMMICENWTEQSGIQRYAIGTDVTDLFVIPHDLGGGVCQTDIFFVLVDLSELVVNIYNSGGSLVRHLVNATAPAGTICCRWSGKNDSQQYVPWGSYRAQITAGSCYKNSSGQPVNTVTKSVWFTLCDSVCQCGDANSDYDIDISDPVFLINYIFAGGSPPGDCVVPQGMGDANSDCAVDIGDAVYLIQYIFAGGPAPLCGTGCK